MTPQTESAFEDGLRALQADDEPRPIHAETLRIQVLAAYDRARSAPLQHPAWQRPLLFGRKIMRQPSAQFVTAAGLLAAIVWLIMPGAPAAAALNKMVDAVLSAKSARFRAEIKVEGQPNRSAKVLYLAPARYRMEIDKNIHITDFDSAKMLTLMPELKQAVVFNLRNMPKDRASLEQHNHFERLQQLLREQRDRKSPYEHLGEASIDGRSAVGFRLESPLGITTLWGDPKTGHPVRIETTYTGVPKTEVAMVQFEVNPELKADLFALDVPKDYQVQSYDIEASKAEEKDLVESLRICAELSGGSFPDALDTQSVMKLMTSTILKSKKDRKVTEQDTQQLMHQAMQIGRGFQFALGLSADVDAHYAGQGVKKDTPNRPIFWYRPTGTQHYRVVDATLTVREAEDAPRITGAIPLAKKKSPVGKQK